VSKEITNLKSCVQDAEAAKEATRERALADAEIAAFWHVTPGATAEVGTLFRLLLLTGQRRSEVLELKWSELDLEIGWGVGEVVSMVSGNGIIACFRGWAAPTPRSAG
jgi:integrase